MDAIQKADKALRVFGEIKRAGVKGGKETRGFETKVMQALSVLTTEEQYTIQRIYVEGLTNEEAAEIEECDASTVSRRKRRALARIAVILYSDQYIKDRGL